MWTLRLVKTILRGKRRNKRRRRLAQGSQGDKRTDQSVLATEDKRESTLTSEEMQTAAKSSQVRTFPNGLLIEEVEMGKSDGKRASPGKQACALGTSEDLQFHRQWVMGVQGAGGQIPPNSWLIFDVELIDVRELGCMCFARQILKFFATA